MGCKNSTASSATKIVVTKEDIPKLLDEAEKIKAAYPDNCMA